MLILLQAGDRGAGGYCISVEIIFCASDSILVHNIWGERNMSLWLSHMYLAISNGDTLIYLLELMVDLLLSLRLRSNYRKRIYVMLAFAMMKDNVENKSN